jgi:hypothetical protein
MTRYGMPYILEDTTGRLTGSEFIDLHDRLRLTVRCTARDACHTSYMIYNTSPGVFQSPIPKPLAGLDFGPGNALGTISLSSVGMSMRKYLTKPTPVGRYILPTEILRVSRLIFGQLKAPAICGLGRTDLPMGEASAARSGMDGPLPVSPASPPRLTRDSQCTNANGYVIASYSLKAAGEPDYSNSSGCILEIAEQFGSLAAGAHRAPPVIMKIINNTLRQKCSHRCGSCGT